MGTIISKLVGSLLRHGLTGLGVWLVSKGIIDDAETVTGMIAPLTDVTVGVIVFLVGLGASLFKDQIQDKIAGVFTTNLPEPKIAKK